MLKHTKQRATQVSEFLQGTHRTHRTHYT
jgi:hypothetical protein